MSSLWKFLAPLLVLVGVAALLTGWVATIDATREYTLLRDHGITVEATVTAVTFRKHDRPSGKSYLVIAQFMTANGQVGERLSVRGTSAEGVKVDGHVQVTYDSQDPSRAEPRSSTSPEFHPSQHNSRPAGHSQERSHWLRD